MFEKYSPNRIGPIDDDPMAPIAANSSLREFLPHRRFMHRGTVFFEQLVEDGFPPLPTRRLFLVGPAVHRPANDD